MPLTLQPCTDPPRNTNPVSPPPPDRRLAIGSAAAPPDQRRVEMLPRSPAFSRPFPPSPAASPPDVSSLYIVRLRSAPPVASYRGGFPGFPATAVWDSDPNGNARDSTSDGAAHGSVAVGTASVSSSASAAGAATTSGLGRLGRRLRRPRVNVRAPAVRAFKQLLQRMQQAVLRDSRVGAGKMLRARVERLLRDAHAPRFPKCTFLPLPQYARPPFSATCTCRSNGFSATLTPAQVQRMRRHPSVASVAFVTQARVLRPATTHSYNYMHASNGFSATLTPAQVQRIKRHPSVASVTQARVLRPATTHSYKFLGLPGSLWADAGGPSSAGDGTVIGIVDTGIWPEHASFDDTGYSSTLPSGWAGTCPTTSDFACNNKIIGGGVFHAGFESGGTTIDLSADWDSPRDSFGHGTWAAAGNSNVQISNMGTASGMAPGARLAMYKVFWQSGGYLYATSTDIFSAIDQAVADGVDVLSLSLGGASPTDTYFDDVPFISVNAAGVFVAFAAGNEGRPFSPTTNRTLCNFAPYYMTVGASGARIPARISPAATAAPVIAYFSSTGPLAKPSRATPAAYPSNTILKPDIIAPGVELWAAAPDKTVGSGGWFVALSGTSMATPHIAGIAALIIQQRPDWTPSQIMSAMMTTARTTDTNNGAIQNEFGRAATPWEIGAGHVVPSRVVDPGLTYDAGEQDFRNFLAGQDYNWAKGEFGTTSLRALSAKNFNRPAISLPQVHKKVSVTRTVTNVADTTSTYTVRIKTPAGVKVKVSPSRFTIAPGQRKTFTVTVVVKWVSQSFKFGSLTWVDNKGHSVRSVLAVQPSSACNFGC
ncbi:unnamed protein product [Closterium sp. Naga37s-1]|nr:unnamed protein product [Closterium sp. Naga37s-1]